MWRLDAIHEELCWIKASIAGVRQHLGMDHPPFLQVGRVVPPHAQLMGVCHDGASTSGTHPEILTMIARRAQRTMRTSMNAVMGRWEG